MDTAKVREIFLAVDPEGTLSTASQDLAVKTIERELRRRIAEELMLQKAHMFGERETLNVASGYATTLLPQHKPQAMTAIMVYHNTLLNVLAHNLQLEGTDDE